MGNFRYNSNGICSYAPIYLWQDPNDCNLNMILLILLFFASYGLLLLSNRIDAENEEKKSMKKPIES